MSLPSLEDRELGVLKEELGRLEKVYKNCFEVLSKDLTDHGIRALDRINDAIEAVNAELQDRSS